MDRTDSMPDMSTAMPQFGVRAVGSWTAAHGAIRADRLPWSQRQSAGPLARMAAHALGRLWEQEARLGPCPVVLASARGEPSAVQRWAELERHVAAVEGVSEVSTVMAGHQTVAAGLWWAPTDMPVIVLWADLVPAAELAVAMLLDPGGVRARIAWPSRQPSASRSRPHSNPCIGALRLLEALTTGGVVRLDADDAGGPGHLPWCTTVTVQPSTP